MGNDTSSPDCLEPYIDFKHFFCERHTMKYFELGKDVRCIMLGKWSPMWVGVFTIKCMEEYVEVVIFVKGLSWNQNPKFCLKSSMKAIDMSRWIYTYIHI